MDSNGAIPRMCTLVPGLPVPTHAGEVTSALSVHSVPGPGRGSRIADWRATRCASESLRQPGLAQARFVFGQIFRPVRSQRLPERGNAQARIELPHSSHGFARLLHTPGERVAGSGDVERGART